MPNPWLQVPLADYEGHMRHPIVDQLDSLADLFAESLERTRPESVAILGIAGGNGLERIDRTITRRVVGIDINSAYLEAVGRRFRRLGSLELHCRDLRNSPIAIEPVQLVHAALILEHAGAGQCLDNAISLVAREGAISVVLQLPAQLGGEVAATPFSSIETLKSGFQLIDPADLENTLAARQFRLIHQTRRSLPAGKGFWMGVFRDSGVGTRTK